MAALDRLVGLVARGTIRVRVIESREVQRVGGMKPRPIDVRFIAATNRDLRAQCAAGAFREDLFFRLNGTPAAIERLTRHRWPGNIRELKNVMDRAVLLAQGSAIDASDLPIEFDDEFETSTDISAPGPSGHLRKEVEEFERQRIIRALDPCGGNQTKAARVLGISRRTLLTRLDEYDVPRPRK
jgi:two-component system response regulator AtoC